MLKFFNILFLILFLNGCGNGETRHADAEPIAPMANDGSYQLALDTSLTKFRLGFPCKNLAVSSNSTGQALAYIDSNWNMPILLYPGYSGLVDAKESLYVDVGPQPGKILQLFFGDSPIISSPAAKFSSDPNPISNFYNNRISNGSPLIDIVSAANNKNGIKILSGILSVLAYNAVNANGDSVLIISNATGNSIVAAISVLNLNVSTNVTQNSINIPQLNIPPNYNLQWQTSQYSPAPSIVTGSIILNYQIL